MSITLPNMGLVKWDQPTDTFVSAELANNMSKIDSHDHTTTKGLQIPTDGLQNNAVTTAKLASNSVTGPKIASASIDVSKVVPNFYVNLIPTVTTFPASGYDGAQVYWVANEATGHVWNLRYRSGNSSPWELIGAPPPLYAEVVTLETMGAAASFADFPTAGPTVTLPRPGDYYFEHGAYIEISNNAAIVLIETSFNTNGGGFLASGNDSAMHYIAPPAALTHGSTVYRKVLKQAQFANTCKLQYRRSSTGAPTSTIKNRWLAATPIRVS